MKVLSDIPTLYQADVVVIGAGSAGCCAAIAAAEEGRSVGCRREDASPRLALRCRTGEGRANRWRNSAHQARFFARNRETIY